MVQKQLLKQESNNLYENSTQNIPHSIKYFLNYLLFNFDFNVMDAPGKQKDLEMIYYLRNKLIQDVVKYYT